MKFRAVVEYDEEVHSYAVYCPELPGCASAGDTEEEALLNIREAIALYLEPTFVEVSPDGKVLRLKCRPDGTPADTQADCRRSCSNPPAP